MDLEKLEKLAKLIVKDLSALHYSVSLLTNPDLAAKFRNLMLVAQESLPEYNELFRAAYQKTDDFYSAQAWSLIIHLLQIIELEKASETNIEKMKIFESAEDQLKQVNISFRKDDYTSAFHNLNTTLELVLKDKLGIPSTITSVNTSNIIGCLDKIQSRALSVP